MISHRKPRRRYLYAYKPPGSDYMMRGMTDMTRMAVGGMIGIGMINAVGSIIKK